MSNTILGHGMSREALAYDTEQSDIEYIIARQRREREQREYEQNRLYRVTEQWHGGIRARVVSVHDTQRKAKLAYNRLGKKYALTGEYPYMYGWEAESLLDYRARMANEVTRWQTDFYY